MTRDNISSEERQLRRELKWAREAETVIEQRLHGNIAIVNAHRQRYPIEFQRFVDYDPEQIRTHIERLERDLESLEGGFL